MQGHYVILPKLSKQQKAKVFSLIQQGKPDECWPWTGSLQPNKYGTICINYRRFCASRLVYFITTGIDPGPRGLVCHTCDNPPCCNPAHLWLGTQKENLADAIAKDRFQRGERNGHYTHPESVLRGSKSHFAVLTEEIVSQILQVPRTRGYQPRLARQFGVTYATISKVITGRSWRHVKR